MSLHPGLLAWRDARPARLTRIERALERAIALGYGATYDAVVDGFAPHQALLDDIVAIVAALEPRRRLRVLDVACGTGTMARRLARAGHAVVAVDPVAHLVTRAKRRREPGIGFAHLDIAAGGAFAPGTFDACVSLHTLNWHPRPLALLSECCRLLRPGGHAILLSYTRPATVRATFAAVCGREGFTAAVDALRWLVPTAIFEACRRYTPRYPDVESLHRSIGAAGFDIRESRPVFLAGVSRLVVAQATSGRQRDDGL